MTCHSINDIYKFTNPNHSDHSDPNHSDHSDPNHSDSNYSDPNQNFPIFDSKQNSQITTQLTLTTSL